MSFEWKVHLSEPQQCLETFNNKRIDDIRLNENIGNLIYIFCCCGSCLVIVEVWRVNNWRVVLLSKCEHLFVVSFKVSCLTWFFTFVQASLVEKRNH